jgi:hypothetical protein
MKKWLLLPIVFVILIILPYLIIPNTIIVRKSVVINAKEEALFRSLADSKNWNKWWPLDNVDSTKGNSFQQEFALKSNSYSLTDILTNSLVITIRNKNSSIKSSLDFITDSHDSITLNWSAVFHSSINPFKRVQTYLEAKKIKQDYNIILKKIQSHFSMIENLYNISVKEVAVVDSNLVYMADSVRGYPTTAFIYTLIDQLKSYTNQQGAKQTGYPMLNVFTSDSISYFTKVAIPVSKKLRDSGNIKYKWMLSGGKILVTDVIGENYKIKYASQQLEYYVKDYSRVAPAIPFMSLITDRIRQPDSTKWVTRIYYPIM